jgi:copper chaperone CopZ
MAKTIEIAIYEMRCGHCELTVKNALRAIEGVKKVRVSRFRKRARVTLESGRDVSVQDLIAAVNATGYRAELLTRNQT